MVISILRNQEGGLNIMKTNTQNQVEHKSNPSNPCVECITRAVCANKPMLASMLICPKYMEYVHKRSKEDYWFQVVWDSCAPIIASKKGTNYDPTV